VPPPMPRRQAYRALFAAAGLYNVGWGLYSALDPQWLFRFTGMAPSPYPEIFACLAMVVGLYGLVYWEIARVPERGFALALVGLVGKVLGPIGMAQATVSGAWPASAWVLCLTNDLVWWVPFALYLRASWPYYRAELRASP